MVTKITQPCVFDIHVPKHLTFCHFLKLQFVHVTTKSWKNMFFPLACGRRFRHVMAIDPLVDSIPKLTIDCRASALLHLTGTFLLYPSKANIKHGTRNVPPRPSYMRVRTHQRHESAHAHTHGEGTLLPPKTHIYTCSFTSET